MRKQKASKRKPGTAFWFRQRSGFLGFFAGFLGLYDGFLGLDGGLVLGFTYVLHLQMHFVIFLSPGKDHRNGAAVGKCVRLARWTGSIFVAFKDLKM